MKRGKRYQEAAKLRDKTNLYDAPEAVAIVKKAASAKLEERNTLKLRRQSTEEHSTMQQTQYHQLKRLQQQNSMRLLKLISELDVTDVTLTSRFVEQQFYLMVQVKKYVFSYSLRVIRLKKLQQQEQNSQELRNLFQRFRTKDGSISIKLLQHLT